MGSIHQIKNTGGKIFYGIHFYPGVAQYQNEETGENYCVFLNEETLRKMDPTFAGKPVFVEHVDSVDPNLDKLRSEADGWVIESFYNDADGKHWVKFIVVSDEAERAIRSGMRLSNAYLPKDFKSGGLWNGVPYEKEITSGEYEHLAIVQNPRYEESVIMTPEEFKEYNQERRQELLKIANSHQKGAKMKFSFFKRTKVSDFDPSLSVVLPSSKKEVTLEKLINMADELQKKMKDSESESAKEHAMANLDDMVKMHDGSMKTIRDVLESHKKLNEELKSLKDKKEDEKEKELDLDSEEKDVDVESDLNNEESDEDDHERKVEEIEQEEELKDDLLEHPEDAVHDEDEKEESEDYALKLAEKNLKKKNVKKNAVDPEKKKIAQAKAEKLKNAHLRAYQNSDSEEVVELSFDKVARGKSRYGSNK